jgi:predicted proteasome-type protease
MTIAAAYLTSEGVVFGADSTTTFMQDGGGVGQLLNHAQKIFEVGRPGEGRLGLCTWGNAVVGTASHRTIAARLSDRIDEKTTVARAVDLLAEVVAAEAAAAEKAIRPTGEFGYFVGGWNPGTRECGV